MKKLGFTLAEVLITLVIIGIIAAITIPAMMNNVEGEENVTAYKKALSVMNQALSTEYALEGNTAAYTPQDINGLPSFASGWRGIAAVMAKRANIIDPNVEFSGELPIYTSSDQFYIIATADGLIYGLPKPSTHGNRTSCPYVREEGALLYPDTCGQGWVDVNGRKGPNKKVTYGQNNKQKINDRFCFSVFETNVMPGILPNALESRLVLGNKKSFDIN